MLQIFETLKNYQNMSDANSRWLTAHEDRSANLSRNCFIVLSSCDNSLILVEHRYVPVTKTTSSSSDIKDYGNIEEASIKNACGRIRWYKAAAIKTERTVSGPPSSTVVLSVGDDDRKESVLAIAINSDILIFKNTKPFYKFSLPSQKVTALEQSAWQKMISDPTAEVFKQELTNLKSFQFKDLSPRSQHLLTLSQEDMTAYVEYCKETNGDTMSRPAVAICLAAMNKVAPGPSEFQCLIVATENCWVLVYDSQSFKILHQASVSTSSTTIPSHLASMGVYDVEFRILVACRNQTVCLLRKNWLEGKQLLQTTAPICDMVLTPGDNFIMIATCDKHFCCYTKRGKKLWGIQMDNMITCLALVPLPHMNICLVAVGQATEGSLLLYRGRQLVDEISLPESASIVKFGQLEQEENVLIIITQAGSLIFKILKRTADFSNNVAQNKNLLSNLQSKPLPLPKRSKLFAEQAERQKLNASAMHQNFQQDLIRLRLVIGREILQTMKNSELNISENDQHPLQLSAQVLGLGPKFTLTLILKNLSNDKSIPNLNVILHAPVYKYKIEKTYVQVPLIPPEISYKIETSVTEILDSPELPTEKSTDVPIRIFVVENTQTRPILAASINMPETDLLAYE